MTLWAYLALCSLALSFAALVGGYSYLLGYRRGFSEGKKTEADFWIGAEKQVDQEQTRMWREEAERKRSP